jgi:tetratricopeptide (TPR) repeat protein
MVERVYMGNDWRADHSFRIPRPDLSAETGAPDACTTCHQGQTPDWAAARLAEWYPDPRHRGPHFGQVLARGQADPGAAAADLAALAADPGQPGLARATALWLLSSGADPAQAAAAEPLLADPDPLVRAAAIGVQRAADPQDRVLRLVSLLADPVRSVRMAAARELIDAPVRLPPRIAADMARAMGEWQAALASRLDFPETHLNLGGLALTMRNPPAAAAAFREVVRMDPQRADAWVMLVRIAAATEGLEATRAVLAEALALNPDAPDLLGFAAELEGIAP